MKILFRQKEIADIKSVKEIEKFIIDKNIINNFKSFNIKDYNNIIYLINLTEHINFKDFKAHGFIKKFINIKSHWNIDYWLVRGYSEEESKKNIKSLQSDNSFKLRESKVNNPNKYIGTSNTQIEYWIKKCGGDIEEAEKLLSERQATFSKDKCIYNYGEEIGLEVWNKRQEKWVNTLNNKSQKEIEKINKLKIHTKDSMVRRHGEKEGLIKYESYITKHSNLFNASKWSIEIIDKIILYLCKYEFKKEDFYYGGNGSKEYFLREENDIFFYDFTIPNIGIIIEFNGEHVHPNKSSLTESDYKLWKQAWTNKTSEECYKYDLKKKELANKNGFEILYVWYNEGIESGVDNCIGFINKYLIK